MHGECVHVEALPSSWVALPLKEFTCAPRNQSSASFREVPLDAEVYSCIRRQHLRLLLFYCSIFPGALTSVESARSKVRSTLSQSVTSSAYEIRMVVTHMSSSVAIILLCALACGNGHGRKTRTMRTWSILLIVMFSSPQRRYF